MKFNRLSICMLLATGCASALVASASNAASTACEVTPAAVPNEFSGLEIPSAQIDAAVAQVDALAQKLMAASHIPGMAVAVVHDGKTVFAKGYGVRSLGTRAPVDADTVFQVASMSKPIGATVIARLVGNGVVGWDTRVQKLMPQFALNDSYASRNVTIGDLYSHRSGLPAHIGDLVEDLGFDGDQVVSKLRYVPLTPFRTQFAYTNFGMTAAANAVAAASHASWAQLSDQMLYAPLGMTSTSSRYADFVARPNRAVGHIKAGGRFVVSVPGRDPDAESPAAGVSTSVNDVARWMNLLLANGCANGSQLIAGKALLAAISPQIVSNPPANPRARAGFYGYGFDVTASAAGRVVISHSGAFALGAATEFRLIPSAHIGIVTLTNAWPVGLPETLNAEFADLVQFGRITQDWDRLYSTVFAQMIAPEGELIGQQPPANPIPAQSLDRYAGTYANDFYGPGVVTVANGKLTLQLGPKHMSFDLGHWNGDIFTMLPPGESATPGSISQVTFTNGTMTIEYLNHEGLGVFRGSRTPGP